MEIVKKENGNYFIASDGKKNVISIICGSSALFEVAYSLSKVQMDELLQDPSKLNSFVENVRNNPAGV